MVRSRAAEAAEATVVAAVILAHVPSLSTPGVSWAIRQHADGPTCDCPAFDYSKEPKHCKHTAIYEAAQHAIKRCAEAGHGAEVHDGLYALCPQCLIDVLAAAAVKVRRRYVLKEAVAEVKAKAKAKVHDIRARRKKKGAK